MRSSERRPRSHSFVIHRRSEEEKNRSAVAIVTGKVIKSVHKINFKRSGTSLASVRHGYI